MIQYIFNFAVPTFEYYENPQNEDEIVIFIFMFINFLESQFKIT